MKSLLKINWRRLLLDNWVLKLASLTVAFALWFAVRTVDDPVDDKTFNNIRVTLLNTEQLAEMDKVYEVLDGTDVVKSVTFEAPDSVRDVIEASDIIAVADVDDLTDINTVAIRFSCPKYSNEVTDIRGSISNVKLNIEDKTNKYIDIGKNIIGEVAEGYMLGNVNIEINRLKIEGPESKIDEIDKAVVDINVAGSSDNISMQSNVYFVNAAGEVVSYDSVKHNGEAVNVEVDVLKVKEIPIEFTPTGDVAEGYLLTGVIEGVPETVKVAGRPYYLSEIEQISISEELNVDGATEDLVKGINLKSKLPTGIIFADSEFTGIINVTVYVEEEEQKTVNVRSNNISFQNVPEGIRAEIAEQEMPALIIKGLNEDISTIRESTLKGTIDVASWMAENQITELTAGVHIHSLPIEFELTEGQNVEDEVFIQVLFTVVTGEE